MFQKDMRFAYLADFYGELLDEHTRAVIMAYYDDDLSLAEIAEDEGISRQGVRHIIKKGEEQLDAFVDAEIDAFEARIGLIKRHEDLSELAEQIANEARGLLCSESDAVKEAGERIIALAAEIGEK